MTSLVSDLSKLTSIAEYNLLSLVDLSNLIIAHDVFESKDDVAEIDIGIGKLAIQVDNDSIRYKFFPSDKLDTTLHSCVQKNESPLIKRAEESLANRINNAYKELL